MTGVQTCALPILPPRELFLAADAFFGALKPFARVEICEVEDSASPPITHPSSLITASLPPVAVDRRADNPLKQLQTFLAGYAGRVLLLAETLGRRETMLEYFTQHGIKPAPCASFAEFLASSAPLMLGVVPLAAGFVAGDRGFAVITENELYASQVRSRREREVRKTSSEGMLRDLSEVKVGDPVVHLQHGIGRYLGDRKSVV